MRLRKKHSVLPGFRLAMGFTLVYLALVVLFPLSTLFWKSASLGPAGFWTAVAGIPLTPLYAPNGWLGAPLERLGIKVAFTPFGITLALTFIGLPFVVRTLQPVLESLDPEVEEAAASLGASRL